MIQKFNVLFFGSVATILLGNVCTPFKFTIFSPLILQYPRRIDFYSKNAFFFYTNNKKFLIHFYFFIYSRFIIVYYYLSLLKEIVN